MEKEKEEELIKSAIGGDKNALTELFKEYKPAINSYINRYRYVDVPDIAIEAKAKNLIVDSLDKFDPSKSSFGTYTYQTLRQLNRFVGQNKNVLTIPESRQSKITNYRHTFDELRSLYGREPTSQEISDTMNLNLKEIEMLQKELSRKVISSDGMYGEVPNMPIFTPESSASTLRYAYDILPNPEQKLIMEYTFGMYGKPELKTNAAIAKQLGLSEKKVGREKKKIAGILSKYGS